MRQDRYRARAFPPARHRHHRRLRRAWRLCVPRQRCDLQRSATCAGSAAATNSTRPMRPTATPASRASARLHHLWRRRAQCHQRHCRLLCRTSAGLPSRRHAQHGDAIGRALYAPYAGQRRVRHVPPHDRAGRLRPCGHDAAERGLRNRAADLRGALSSSPGLHGLSRRPGQHAGARSSRAVPMPAAIRSR